ncbi:MAG: 3-hydroxyacyl-ACP dehydratase FabZ [Candidatus Bipolaricaulota bacterium]|nr:MAG: 3-hydroxyacyl-ACP dehydratase FabZ [Candidatus Bipolaricaulota bacterium]
MAEGVSDIRGRLPLRFPYLMVDRILECGPEKVVAIKNVTFNEPFFVGHFPEPLPAVMPGTLIVEAMAQTAGLLGSLEPGRVGFLVGIKSARFRRQVVPGDTLRICATPLRERMGLMTASVEVTVDGERVADATLSLMIEQDGVPDDAAAD